MIVVLSCEVLAALLRLSCSEAAKQNPYNALTLQGKFVRVLSRLAADLLLSLNESHCCEGEEGIMRTAPTDFITLLRTVRAYQFTKCKFLVLNIT